VITHPLLSRLAARGMKLGLEHVDAFLRDGLGGPCLGGPGDPPVVHVAGTNGKGSVCAMVTAALVAAGWRVGTFTSPHLEHVNERVQIDGVPLADAEFEEAVQAVDAARRAWGEAHGVAEPLTYFEATWAVALWAFRRAAVDVVVVEVGLGGRLDATNVVQPAVTAIVSLGLDHCDVLGPTLRHVAAEKAGIAKPGVPMVVGLVPPEAREVVAARCAEVGAPLWWAGAEVRHADGGVRTPTGWVGPLTLGLEGAHQRDNALVAGGLLHALRPRLAVDDAAILVGLARARHPGRLERIAEDLVLDGAHNPDGADVLAAWLAALPSPPTLLFGHGSDREAAPVLTRLLPHVGTVWLTSCAHPKARDAASLADELGDAVLAAGRRLVVGGVIEDDLPAARAAGGLVVVSGSLYLVGAARALASSSAAAG
jgi:dihydrofolate synthase/folylpolyglutamate synthase